jgi:F0F1-type ATP synthase membrane subunit c/vacuolar-type H+-ATPase subunit K
MMQPDETRQPDPAKLYRILIIIWAAMFTSITLFLLLAAFIAPEQPQAQADGNRTMTIIFATVGILVAIASVIFRHRLVAQAVERQQPQQLFPAYIVAFALSEAAAIFGLLNRFTTSDRYYYLLFIVAFIALLLNLPRQSDVVNASSGRRI